MSRRAIEPDVIGSAIALHRSGMTKKKVAASLGVSRDSVKRWTAGDIEPRKAEAVERVEGHVGQRIRENIDTFLINATDIAATGDFAKTMARRPKDLLVGIGIATEKRELLSGRATSRSESLRIELVAGGSLKELAERTMSVRLPLPGRTDIVPSAIEASTYVVSGDKGERLTPKPTK